MLRILFLLEKRQGGRHLKLRDANCTQTSLIGGGKLLEGATDQQRLLTARLKLLTAPARNVMAESVAAKLFLCAPIKLVPSQTTALPSLNFVFVWRDILLYPTRPSQVLSTPTSLLSSRQHSLMKVRVRQSCPTIFHWPS